MKWGNAVELERKLRIDLAVWAYAYDFRDDPLVSDATFDKAAAAVDTSVTTGNAKLDTFFREKFSPDTGMWVRQHPDIEGLCRIYERKRKGNNVQEKKFGIGGQALLAKQIRDDLNAHTAAIYDDGHRKHLGASLIGDNCSRKLWYGFRWVYRATYINAKGENHKGRMMRLFNRGHKEEIRIVEWLRGIGIIVKEFDDDGKTQMRIEDIDGHFGGSLDGKARLPEKYRFDEELLAEFKTSSDKYFDKLVTNGVKLEKPMHFAQMSSYGKRKGLRYGLYICVNKNTDDIYIEIVELDWALADQLTIKAERIIRSTTPPPKLSENSAFFECKFCDFAPVCHGQQPYEKSCRSCKYAAPVANKQWQCAKWGVIPEQAIAQGCDYWEEAR